MSYQFDGEFIEKFYLTFTLTKATAVFTPSARW